ncbi:MAG: DUF4178 domain-containing protein [Nannocystaceae bacterium]
MNQPVPIFRDEAKTSALQCPACGAPIQRTGFGAIVRVVCSHCGSELSPTESDTLRVLLHVQRQQRPSILPLHLRGELGGAQWEIIGIVWREVTADGKVYPWQEFLLYNPYLGYRYLLHFLYDRHWALGTPLDGAPVITVGNRPTARWRQHRFRHFQRAQARTIYVEGEFPWQVRVGDVVTADDYVAPPLGLSVEQSVDESGTDLQFTLMEHLDGAAVYRAFGLKATPPRPTMIGPLQPNRWAAGRALTWVSCAVLLLVWLAATIVYSSSRQDREVYRGHAATPDPISDELDLGDVGTVQTIEVELSATPLSNAWAYAEVLLVPLSGSEDAVGVGLEVDEWHGVSDGESWHEGDSRARTAVGAVPGGRYAIQVAPQSGTGTPGAPAQPLEYTVVVRRDVVLARYILFPFLVIVGFPLVLGLAALGFESARWRQSDYAPQS